MESWSSLLKILQWKTLIEPNKPQERHRARESFHLYLSSSRYVPFEKDVRECSVSSWVPQHLHAGILGLALCVAFELEEGIEASLSCEVWILANRIWSHYNTGTFSLVQSNHLWLNYYPCRSFDELDEMLETERSLFHVSFEVSEATLRRCLGFAIYASEQRMTKVLFANMNCP